MDDRYLKCRYCGYTVLKTKKLKNGDVISGWSQLLYHVADDHPEKDDEHQVDMKEAYYRELDDEYDEPD